MIKRIWEKYCYVITFVIVAAILETMIICKFF